MNINNQTNKTKPFLRWTGSKRWFVKDHIKDFLPIEFSNYHEPFLGGGAVFFSLQECDKKKCYLSDSNFELTNTYIQLRDNPNGVIEELGKMKNNLKEYLTIRQLNPDSLTEKAARFIYLNRTSFNGIYRVNDKGQYNVPYGKRQNVQIVTSEIFEKVTKKLQNSVINNCDFYLSINNVKKGDLVFIDPPYTVSHENNGFIEYNQKLFSWEDQIRLRDFVIEINEIGANFILTNASHKSLFDLYKGIAPIKRISRYSQVGGRNKTRGMYNEIVIYNT